MFTLTLDIYQESKLQAAMGKVNKNLFGLLFSMDGVFSQFDPDSFDIIFMEKNGGRQFQLLEADAESCLTKLNETP